MSLSGRATAHGDGLSEAKTGTGAGAVTRMSNTGDIFGDNSGIRHTIGLDTVSVTMWAGVAFATAWAAGLMDVERDEFVEQGYGMHFYRGLRIGPLGCRVKHGPLGTEEERCTVDLASKAMECVGTRDLIEGLRALSVSEIRWQVPRADVALDGVGCHPDDAGAIFRGGTVRKCRAHRSSNGRKENRDGVTVYIGDRHSPRFLRVYNRRGPTRFELECKDEAAGHVVFGLMVREASEWGDYLRGVLLDFVDFGAPWWAAAMAGVVPVRLPLRRVRDLSIEDKMRWLERSVSRTLAEVGIACDWAPEVLQGLIDKGYRKAGNRRRLH